MNQQRTSTCLQLIARTQSVGIHELGINANMNSNMSWKLKQEQTTIYTKWTTTREL